MRCWAMTASFSTRVLRRSCTACVTRADTSAFGSSKPSRTEIDFNRNCIIGTGVKYSSFTELQFKVGKEKLLILFNHVSKDY